MVHASSSVIQISIERQCRVRCAEIMEETCPLRDDLISRCKLISLIHKLLTTEGRVRSSDEKSEDEARLWHARKPGISHHARLAG
jgi:hypothetical protein